MQTIILTPTVTHPSSCTIHIGLGAIEAIGSLYDFSSYSKIFVVTDETVAPLLFDRLAAALPATPDSIVLPAGEQHKNIDTVQRIWTALYEAGCDRTSLVINLGGGVIGDLGGFAASTFMRGISFVNVPTTLLAQVDSGIGGKTGCNFAGVKNLIGSFAQPLGSVIDPAVLDTIDDREFLSGFAEIIKHGLIRDRDYFELVTAKRPRDFSQDELVDIITRSCHIKAAIVESDTTEGGARKLVNFGHSVGHAIEALSHDTDQPLLHGEAISIGMVAEAALSQRQGLLPEADVQRLTQALQATSLPVRLPAFPTDALLQKMHTDKKNERGQLNFTLLTAIGHGVYDQTVAEPIVVEVLQSLADQNA